MQPSIPTIMTLEDKLIEAVQLDPFDRTSAFALADFLEEDNWPRTAFALRWMGVRNLRPGFREGKRIEKPHVWYLKDGYLEFDKRELPRRNANPRAHLPSLVFSAMRPGGKMYLIYENWQDAVMRLAEGLHYLQRAVSLEVNE